MKKFRFFFHYYRQYNCMSVHFKGKCYKVLNIECNTNTETHWSKTQPYLIMRGWCSEIIIEKDKAIIVD